MKPIFRLLITALFAGTGAMAQPTVQKQTFVYATRDSVKLQMDTYVDQGVVVTGKRPVMIYVHGGGFAMGSKTNALQIQYGKHFAAQGFVSVAINYRLGLANKKQPDQETVLNAVNMAAADLIDATAFILSKADEWNIDTSKIIISGGSAGAITCLNAEYEICTNGKMAQKLPKGFNYAGIISQAGCIVTKQDTLNWKKAPCPILLMHGSKDDLVPFNKRIDAGYLYAGSTYLQEQFIHMNQSHWFYEEVGADHIIALKPLQHNFGEIDAFIDRFVMKKQQAIVHTQWKPEKPDSMQDMMTVVPLYIQGWDKTDEEVRATEKPKQ